MFHLIIYVQLSLRLAIQLGQLLVVLHKVVLNITKAGIGKPFSTHEIHKAVGHIVKEKMIAVSGDDMSFRHIHQSRHSGKTQRPQSGISIYYDNA